MEVPISIIHFLGFSLTKNHPAIGVALRTESYHYSSLLTIIPRCSMVLGHIYLHHWLIFKGVSMWVNMTQHHGSVMGFYAENHPPIGTATAPVPKARPFQDSDLCVGALVHFGQAIGRRASKVDGTPKSVKHRTGEAPEVPPGFI